jgi:hypothetical protein
MAIDIEKLKSYQTGSRTIISSTTTVIPGASISNVASGSLQKTIQSVSKLSSKSNEISSFLNNASIASGNGPFNLSKFAREFITKQNNADKTQGNTTKVTDSKPITRKSKQLIKKVVDTIVANYLRSDRLLITLEKQINKVLKQSNVSYLTIENGQIKAQPIQNKEIDQVINNFQKTINTYVEAVDKYARRIYNTDPIRTTNDLSNNLSLNHMVDFIKTIVSIALLILNLKIKIRKARDKAAAANALLTTPPQPIVAASFIQASLVNTADEQKKLDDLAAAQELILGIKNKIDFYGGKYQKSKNKLLNLKATIDNFQSQLFNSALSGVNNQLTGSISQLSTQVDTRVNQLTGSL